MTTLSHNNFALHELLTDQGAYIHEHYPDSFEDIGGAESGPKLVGGPAFDAYSGESHDFIVDESGKIVHVHLIDWEDERLYGQMTGPEPDEDNPDLLNKPKPTGDFVVWYYAASGDFNRTCIDKVWFACQQGGWTDKRGDRGYFSISQARDLVEKFNLSSRAGKAYLKQLKAKETVDDFK